MARTGNKWNRSVHEPAAWPKRTDLDEATRQEYGYESMSQLRHWRRYKALGYVPPAEFKQQWQAAGKAGALSPEPQDLVLDASKQNRNAKKPHPRSGQSGCCSDGRPTLRLRPRRALPFGRRQQSKGKAMDGKTFRKDYSRSRES